MMTRAASKRAKMDSTSTVSKSPSPEDNVVSAQPPSFIPFHTGPSLERIPDDVLLEVVSYLPTFDDSRRAWHPKYVISSAMLARTRTLRALSKTSKLLRSRCLAIAWQNVKLCGIDLGKQRLCSDMVIGEVTEAGIRVLNACPYLLPFIQTVSVILGTYRQAKIIPELAGCLATIPNLDTIQVIFVDSGSRMQTVIKDAFRGKQFPSVRRITLPSSACEIIRRCPNVEEVTCVDGGGGQIVQSLVVGECRQVRILRGIHAPLTRLADLLPNLTHASVTLKSDMTPLTNFPFLDTIEILINCYTRVDLPLSEFAALDIKKAREILMGNKSQAEKTVVLMKSNKSWDYRAYQFDVGQTYTTIEVVKV